MFFITYASIIKKVSISSEYSTLPVNVINGRVEVVDAVIMQKMATGATIVYNIEKSPKNALLHPKLISPKIIFPLTKITVPSLDVTSLATQSKGISPKQLMVPPQKECAKWCITIYLDIDTSNKGGHGWS